MATVKEERDRARLLVKHLTAQLDDEHNRNLCGCGKPSVGDCATIMLIQRADDHLTVWGTPRSRADA